jgi:hypothetical protein
MGFQDFLRTSNSEVSTASTADMLDELRKRSNGKNVFPLEIFHPRIKPYINELHSKMDVPRGFIGLCMLMTYSTAIGTAYAVSRNGSDRVNMSLWGCMNGISSSGKSMALDLIMKPLHDLQNELDEEWIEKTSNLTDYQRQQLPFKTLVFRDIHVPTLIRSVMPFNPKGIMKEADEILEWINGLNGLTTKEGVDEQFWLSGWNGRKYSAVRSGNNSVVIKRVYANIIGGIQPELVPRLFKNDRGTSGFVFRILFAQPEITRIASPEDGYDIPVEYKAIHQQHITKLYKELPMEVDTDPRVCLISKEALAVMRKWHDQRRHAIDRIQDSREMNIHSGILGKIKEYITRFAGILAVSDFAYNMADTDTYFAKEIPITSEIMARAIKAGDYFFNEAVAVYEAVDNSVTAPLNILYMAQLFKMNKTLSQMAELIYKKRDAAHKARINRELKRAIKDYPKVFGANNN